MGENVTTRKSGALLPPDEELPAHEHADSFDRGSFAVVVDETKILDEPSKILLIEARSSPLEMSDGVLGTIRRLCEG